jgi:AraC-like DNA-binding protein
MTGEVKADVKELGLLVGPGLSDPTPVRRRAFTLSSELPVRADIGLYPVATPWDADVHQEFEFGIVLAGEEERRTGLPGGVQAGRAAGGERLRPGDIWLIAMWEPHWWRAVTPGTTDVYLQFSAGYLGAERVGRYSWFELFAPAPRERPRVASPALRGAVRLLGQRIREELARRRQSWERAVRLDVLRVLVEMERDWDPPSSLASGRQSEDADLREIMPALTEVNSQLPNRIPLPEAAGLCGMSRARFCSVFKRSMGVSFARFALRARLAWVSSQLLSGDQSIASIAAGAGFADESHLHRTFLRYYGCTPGLYRRTGGNDSRPSAGRGPGSRGAA